MQYAVSIPRVSTRKQLNEGEGIENQRRANNEYIKRRGYVLSKEIVIAESAAVPLKERYDLEEALNLLFRMKKQGQADVVVFYKSDRLSRGGGEEYFPLKALLQSHGVRVEYSTEQIDDSASGELLEHVLAGIARFENRLRTERTVGAEKILTQEGYWCRSAPTGFVNARDRLGKPILRPHLEDRQWELLGEGLRKQMTGNHKLTDVARELRAKGFLTNKGNPLSNQSWAKICRHSVYGGLLCERWTDYQVVRAKFDGPLTPAEWHKLQDVLDGRDTLARRLPRQHMHPDFPLRRFLRCPQCDTPTRGYHAVKKNGKRFCYYDCRHSACRFRIPVTQAHQQFLDLLQKNTPSPPVLEAFRHMVLDVWQEQFREINADGIALQQKVATLRQEKRSILEAIKKSNGNAQLLAALQEEFARVDHDLASVTVERNDSRLSDYDPQAVVGYCSYFLEHAVELWQKWPVDLQNRLQFMVFPDGLPAGDLEGCRTAKLSEIHALLADPVFLKPLAGPRLRVTNRVTATMIDWFEKLKGLPLAGNAVLPM